MHLPSIYNAFTRFGKILNFISQNQISLRRSTNKLQNRKEIMFCMIFLQINKVLIF